MKTILLRWELGGGLGHAARLLEIADALAERGHSPILALKDLRTSAPLLRDRRHRVVQAPLWLAPPPPGFQASRFTDVLGIAGYAEPHGLGLLVHAWRTIVEQTRADAVVCDFAPTLHLAASGEVPCVTIGIGFAVPPAEGDDFPTINPQAAPTFDPAPILANIREALARRGRPAPATLPEALGSGDRFVHTLPEIDAYRGFRRDEMVEPLHRPTPPASGPIRHFFPYLSGDFPRACDLLSHLAASGFAGEAYLRNATAPQVALRGAGVAVRETPPPIGRAASEAAVVIHHGGLNTTESALCLGRAKILLPIHLEQGLTARAVAELGSGRALVGRQPLSAISDAVAVLSRPGGPRDRASAFAAEVRARAYAGCLSGILSCCEA
ncbi:glycosyltransferase family 1 protein [Paludisphaera soli]|uniref:glycosyltransferase family 1 protein n=1 Tax=Paludisphaera soli TaxID=2712865 RepID=UPI0013EB7583|nr:glycosyltransferase family 1 protein [Paludisphaera soli]